MPRKESEVSLLSSQLKELEDKAQEILYLQQELNELNASLKEEKWYSAALKEEVDKITKEKVELEEKNSILEKVFLVLFSKSDTVYSPLLPLKSSLMTLAMPGSVLIMISLHVTQFLNCCVYFVSEGTGEWN